MAVFLVGSVLTCDKPKCNCHMFLSQVLKFHVFVTGLSHVSELVVHVCLEGVGGVGAKWAKIRPILTLMNFSKKQQCPVNVFLPLNMHHELSEQNKIAQFYSDEMSKLR